MTDHDAREHRHPKVEFYPDKRGAFRFRIVGANGENVHTSEPYATPANAHRGWNDLVAIVSQLAPLVGDATALDVPEADD